MKHADGTSDDALSNALTQFQPSIVQLLFVLFQAVQAPVQNEVVASHIEWQDGRVGKAQKDVAQDSHQGCGHVEVGVDVGVEVVVGVVECAIHRVCWKTTVLLNMKHEGDEWWAFA